jgi:hypothetical protein
MRRGTGQRRLGKAKAAGSIPARGSNPKTDFTMTFNLTTNMEPDNTPRRFLVAISSTSLVIAANRTVDPTTARINCFASKDPDVRAA